LLNHGDQILLGETHLTFYANEGTRPFQLPSSRGRELHIGKAPDSQTTKIARLHRVNPLTGPYSIELLSEMTIGRSRDCSIFLEDLAVSRHHATIRELPGGDFELCDNRSATGTFVNGRPVARHLLHEGDAIEIGTHQFIFRLTLS
jgi:pSer/pThr/pTyr-binding forkhead associated (FHA) protein